MNECERCHETPCRCGNGTGRDEREVFGCVFDENPDQIPQRPGDDD